MLRSSFARGEQWGTERLSNAPQITLPGRQPGRLVFLTAVPEPAHLSELERETSPVEERVDVENKTFIKKFGALTRAVPEAIELP